MGFLKHLIHKASQAKSSNLAEASWTPSPRDTKALSKHSYVDALGRVDQIWDWLEQNHGGVLAVHAPHATHPESYTYAELAQQITNAAAAFRCYGIGNDDVVSVFAENSPRWLIADQAIMRAGASNAVRGANTPMEELRYIFQDSGAIGLIVQNAQIWDKLALSDDQKKHLRLVLQLEGEPTHPQVIGWDAFLINGTKTTAADAYANRGPETSTSAIATILYTSGTTGRPKGVPLTHANLLHQIKSLACIAYPPSQSPVLSVLPIWHAYERSAEYYFFSCGCTQTYTTIKQLKNDLPLVKPVVMATVPRLWEAIYLGFEEALKDMPPSRQRLIRGALANSSSYKLSLRQLRNLLIEESTFLQRSRAALLVALRWPLHLLASRTIWPKALHKLTGGRLLYPINGGGAIAPHVDLFFEALGVELLVGYGLTETSPVVSCRRTWRNIRGSSGSPLPKTEFRIIDLETGLVKKFRQKGLVLVKGEQVMSGYLGKPQATSNVLDSEGWFNTGDIGMLLPDGSLVLTGRAKDTIVLSSGENIEPGPLEEYLVASPLFEQVMLVGQDERKLGILIVPNIKLTIDWASKQNISVGSNFEAFAENQTLKKILLREVNDLLSNRKGSRPDERICGIALVEPFTLDNGLLTQTLKQKREQISLRDFDAIEKIYGR